MKNAEKKITSHAETINQTSDLPNVSQDTNHAEKFVKEERAGSGFLAEIKSEHYVDEGISRLEQKCVAYRVAYKDMINMQEQMLKEAKVLTSKTKDYTNQIGNALAKIDTVQAKGFEQKLIMLERFVTASKSLVELEQSGSLQKVSDFFAGAKNN